MDSLFEFVHVGETAASKLFSFHSEMRLFHFLAENGVADITFGTPHLTDSEAAVPSGEASSTVSVAPMVTPTQTAGTTAESDTFLKSLSEDKQKASDDLVLQSLIKSEEKGVEKRKSILGELPKIDTSLFIDQEYHLKKQLNYVRIAFASLITLGFGLYVFFFMQLNPSGNFFTTSNVGKNLETTSEALRSTMTEINFYRYKSAAAYFDQFFYSANEFLQKYDAWQAADDEKKRDELTADLEKAKTDLTKPFEAARDILAKQNYTVVYREKPLVDSEGKSPEVASEEEKTAVTAEFHDLLRADISDKRRAALDSLKLVTSPTDKETKRDELRNLSAMYQLVGNPQLLKLISTDVKKMSHEQLKKHIMTISSKYNHRLAFTFQIKDKRIPWAALIREIYAKTEAADERFATKLFKDFGGIQYTGFDFDGTSGKLTVSGNVKDSKGLNFNILASLIDQLEGSTKFKDVDMRNFSKTLNEKEGYEGNFKIDMSLQPSSELDVRDKVIDLSNGAKLFASDETLKKVMEKIAKDEKKEEIKDETKDEKTSSEDNKPSNQKK
jgi:hypothetical protein